MSMSDWNKRWDALRQVCTRRSLVLHNWRLPADWGDKPNPPAIVLAEPPASEDEVAEVEKQIGRRIPSTFRRVLREYSRKLDVCWMFPESDQEYKCIYDELFRSFSWGILTWSLESLPGLQKDLKRWNDNMYNNPDDSYDKHWLGKFAICEVDFQDYIVIEAENEDSQRVVFLSHDGDDYVNGFAMGKDFEDFVDRMSLLGCPSHSLYPFMDDSKPYLQVDSENARLWREWFGLNTD